MENKMKKKEKKGINMKRQKLDFQKKKLLQITFQTSLEAIREKPVYQIVK